MDFKLKNYVKEGQKLPMFGVGPYLIYGIAIMNAIVIILASYVFKAGILEGGWLYLFRIAGALLIILGIAIWFIGAVRSDMDESITENKLKTDGIYSWVRNPMYTGCWFIIIGVGYAGLVIMFFVSSLRGNIYPHMYMCLINPFIIMVLSLMLSKILPQTPIVNGFFGMGQQSIGLFITFVALYLTNKEKIG